MADWIDVMISSTARFLKPQHVARRTTDRVLATLSNISK